MQDERPRFIYEVRYGIEPLEDDCPAQVGDVIDAAKCVEHTGPKLGAADKTLTLEWLQNPLSDERASLVRISTAKHGSADARFELRVGVASRPALLTAFQHVERLLDNAGRHPGVARWFGGGVRQFLVELRSVRRMTAHRPGVPAGAA
ncbi:hypothetical protein PYV02_14625 [Leifsonia sp. H3M29-4]|uniref:hypothetical protein n=1 Tax=Salinibacterium metalliresistens TaxID=3031321 RepID=UPI0023DA210B|nr:hypothetical protein [Salinibacterium metalliresistens]MDF1480318.1 hypothetical protein [Salinibacterium metalliresistens]